MHTYNVTYIYIYYILSQNKNYQKKSSQGRRKVFAACFDVVPFRRKVTQGFRRKKTLLHTLKHNLATWTCHLAHGRAVARSPSQGPSQGFRRRHTPRRKVSVARHVARTSQGSVARFVARSCRKVFVVSQGGRIFCKI